MRNPVSLGKQYRRREALSSQRSKPSSWLVLALLPAVGAMMAAAAIALQAAGQPAAFSNGGIVLPGRPAPELARLFTPRVAPAGTYQVTVLGGGAGDAVRQVTAAMPAGCRLASAPGAWQAEFLDPLDAFGRAGDYNRARVARLYLGRKVQVIRGPIERDGRTVGALTLFSPYPDPALARLEPGTLAILMRPGR
jgi:hypothetical protein